MGKYVSFSGRHLALSEIVKHHIDVEASLRSYFSPASNSYSVRFAGYVSMEIKEELELRLSEHNRATIFSILSALEAAFRIDYLQRCYKKKKDVLSREFRDLYKNKGFRVSLEDDILAKWKECTPVSNKLIADLKGAFKYRHWIAHGRYWALKLGQKYDYESIYILAETIFNSFPLEGIKNMGSQSE